MAIFILLIIRLLPVGGILLLKRGEVSGWVLLLALLSTLALVVLGTYIDYLLGNVAANDYCPEGTDPLRARLQRLVPFRLVTWLIYGSALILLLVV